MINENKLIRLCSTVSLDSTKIDVLNEITNESLDWEHIVKFSSSNRVFPLLYQNLKTHCSHKVPPQVLDQLRSMCFVNLAKNLQLFTQLCSVVDLFRKYGIEVLAFKGPVLAEDIYGDIGLRFFSDLDLLLTKNDLHQAILLLQDEKFQMDIELNIEQFKALAEKSHHAVMVKGLVVIELHWELSGRYFTRPVRLEDVADRAEGVEIQGRTIKTLGSEDLLVYLCVHGSRHFWVHMESVCSVNELVLKKYDLDWKLVVRIAEGQGAKKMLILGLLLAHRLFGLTIPKDILPQEQSKSLNRVCDRITQRMLCQSNEACGRPTYWQSIKYHFVVMDKWRDWIRYSLKPVTNPTHSDWLWLRVPAVISPFYYVLRPIRLIVKYCKKFFL